VRNLDFSSWQALLSTLLGLAVITLIGVGIRLIVLQRVQRRRERENRQINERLRSLIAAYKTLGGSFTGTLAVDPTHLRDLRRGADGGGDPEAECRSSDRSRRIPDAVEAALSDVVLLGTEEQVRLAAKAATELAAGRPVGDRRAGEPVGCATSSAACSDLDPVPQDVSVPSRPAGARRPPPARAMARARRAAGTRRGAAARRAAPGARVEWARGPAFARAGLSVRRRARGRARPLAPASPDCRPRTCPRGRPPSLPALEPVSAARDLADRLLPGCSAAEVGAGRREPRSRAPEARLTPRDARPPHARRLDGTARRRAAPAAAGPLDLAGVLADDLVERRLGLTRAPQDAPQALLGLPGRGLPAE
jgi:heme exporter protein D